MQNPKYFRSHGRPTALFSLFTFSPAFSGADAFHHSVPCPLASDQDDTVTGVADQTQSALLPQASLRRTLLSPPFRQLPFASVGLGLDFARYACHNIGHHHLAAGPSPAHNKAVNRIAFPLPLQSVRLPHRYVLILFCISNIM